jgi:hypothetical protein
MTVRKHSNKVLGGVGIDGTEGENFSREHAVSPWDPNPRGNFKSPRGAGAYQDANADFLTNKLPAEIADSETRDIWDAVEGQSGPNDRKIRSRGQP